MPSQPYLAAPAPPARQPSPPSPEDPQDLLSYIAWFKLHEPLLADSIEDYLVVLSKEKGTLGTLEGISEARIARHELPAGLMARMRGICEDLGGGQLAKGIGASIPAHLGHHVTLVCVYIA